LSRSDSPALPEGGTNDLLRRITGSSSINTRRDALRDLINSAPTQTESEMPSAASNYSLDDLLRQIVVGAENQEETT
jgi:hypothetical protein